ncbi:MAG: acetyl-CoA carboxylase biotin carboxyl carrier protein [Bacillota bacterium]
MDFQEIRELIRLIDQTSIAELSLESNGIKIAIKKGPGGPESAEDKTVADLFREAKEKGSIKFTEVVSPMVGTFYRAPAPDAPPFVQAGDIVQTGQTLCIIEAMKMLNEIKAEITGEIVEILVENGESVEYGQPLFYMKPVL